MVHTSDQQRGPLVSLKATLLNGGIQIKSNQKWIGSYSRRLLDKTFQRKTDCDRDCVFWKDWDMISFWKFVLGSQLSPIVNMYSSSVKFCAGLHGAQRSLIILWPVWVTLREHKHNLLAPFDMEKHSKAPIKAQRFLIIQHSYGELIWSRCVCVRFCFLPPSLRDFISLMEALRYAALIRLWNVFTLAPL